MPIFFILGIPVLLSLAALIFGSWRRFAVINAIGYSLVLFFSALLAKEIIFSWPSNFRCGFIYLDILSAFFILVISVVAFASALYSVGYIAQEIEEGTFSRKKSAVYYLLFNLFCLSMFFVPAVNNLGMLWAAIEMTTLVSAVLVGFYNTKESVEASWKYIIICSVGIIFALLGTVLFSYAFSHSGISKSLNWSDIIVVSHILDKNILKIAFIFILVGYGTKAGLAPMHTWLPDAHSQAPSPISALLSGVLLKTAVYAILRFGMIVVKGVGLAYFCHLMLLFGLVSLGVSCGFILVQKDLKRLLAYSSIEHIGIISIGFGLGAPLAIAGALLHVFNHAVAKSLLFFGAGHIVSSYKKHNMNAIRGVIKAVPFTGMLVLLGVFALTGFPPFSIFFSEMMIVISAFTGGSYFIASALLFFLAIIFGAFIYHFGKMLFGNLPKGMAVKSEPLSMKLAMIFLALLACAVILVFPFIKKELIWMAEKLF